MLNEQADICDCRLICKRFRVLVPQTLECIVAEKASGLKCANKKLFFCLDILMCFTLGSRTSRFKLRLHTISSCGFGGNERLVRTPQYVIEFTVSGYNQAEAD